MLERSSEMEDTDLPVVSICIVADKNKAPQGFVPITKTHDDATDADLWREGFGFSLFSRQVRYIAVSRKISAEHSHLALEVVIDLAVISDKEAVPTSFVCIDFTADSKERALKKKFLCARFASRNDSLDAVTDVVVLAKSRRAPKSYTLAGEVDGMLICFKVSTIPDGYARLSHSQSTSEISSSQDAANKRNSQLYPPIAAPGPHSQSIGDLASVGGPHGQAVAAAATGISSFTIRQSAVNHVKGVDGVPFQLNPVFARALDTGKDQTLPEIPELRSLQTPSVNLRLERQVLS